MNRYEYKGSYKINGLVYRSYTDTVTGETVYTQDIL